MWVEFESGVDANLDIEGVLSTSSEPEILSGEEEQNPEWEDLPRVVIPPEPHFIAPSSETSNSEILNPESVSDSDSAEENSAEARRRFKKGNAARHSKCAGVASHF
jgi:hypothetical protein